MSKVNRNCFLSVDSCLLDLSVGSIFKIDKLSRISWKSIHFVLASRIHLFAGGEKKKKPPHCSLLCSDLCSGKDDCPGHCKGAAEMCCERQGPNYVFDDSGMNIQNTISAYKI